MTHHRFATGLQTQYQTRRFEGVRREVTEHYRFGIALSKLKQHPVGRGPDPETSLSISDQVRESLAATGSHQVVSTGWEPLRVWNLPDAEQRRRIRTDEREPLFGCQSRPNDPRRCRLYGRHSDLASELAEYSSQPRDGHRARCAWRSLAAVDRAGPLFQPRRLPRLGGAWLVGTRRFRPRDHSMSSDNSWGSSTAAIC